MGLERAVLKQVHPGPSLRVPKDGEMFCESHVPPLYCFSKLCLQNQPAGCSEASSVQPSFNIYSPHYHLFILPFLFTNKLGAAQQQKIKISRNVEWITLLVLIPSHAKLEDSFLCVCLLLLGKYWSQFWHSALQTPEKITQTPLCSASLCLLPNLFLCV